MVDSRCYGLTAGYVRARAARADTAAGDGDGADPAQDNEVGAGRHLRLVPADGLELFTGGGVGDDDEAPRLKAERGGG